MKNLFRICRGILCLSLGVSILFCIPASAEKPVNNRSKKDLSGAVAPSKPVDTEARPRSSSGLHKLSVTDRALLSSLQAQGARVISDYGSFVLVEANEQLAENAATKGAQVVDENNLVLLNAGTIDTTAEKPATTLSDSGGGKQMHLIQFAGPIRPEWYRALQATGARIVTYIPNNAYLMYGTLRQLEAVQSLAQDRSRVQWNGKYTATHRLHPRVTALAAAGVRQPNLTERGNEQFVIQLVEDADENNATLALINNLKLEPIISQDKALGYVNVKVALPRESLVHQIAERPDVVSIQQWVTPVMNCERQDMLMAGNLTGTGPTPGDYLAYLTGKGFNVNTAAGFGVNISDSGLDNGTTTPDHFVFYTQGDPTNAANSRVSYVVNGGSSTELRGCHGHGHINASIIGGYVPTGISGGVNFGAFPHADGSGFRWGLGIAPFVKVGMSVIFSASGLFTNPNYETLESNAYAAGMRISSNSWGSHAFGAYNSDSQRYDALVRDAQSGTSGNQEYTIVFSAGNDGSGSQTTGAPGTGKNVITVGAAEDVNPIGGTDGSGVGDSGADNSNDIIGFSSRGPTTDGRKKPDIVGPGTHVSGAAPQSGPNTARTGNGAHLACFTAGGVSGGPAGSDFFPLGQEWYTASSGTSHSCPAVAGTVALYRQYFINQALTPPSPAMNKALLMNSARYLNGVGANDTLWSNSQGMGEANLNNFFDIFASTHTLHDQNAGEMFTASGQQRSFAGTIPDATKPFRVTLAWTEPPGSTSGNAFVNNLDLEVVVGGNTYKGNVFSGAFSTTGGAADTRDNVESVFIPAGTGTSYVVTIKATNIAGDGVPGNGQPLDQDYALVTYNGNEMLLPVIAAAGKSITAESAFPPNNVPDPGETLTMNFNLADVGTADTTNLVATLQNSGGVTPVTTSQTYGVVTKGGPAVSKPFTFVASGACGSNITATLHLMDGALDLGNVTYVMQLGITNTQTFSNPAAITIPASGTGDTNGAPATPYPSAITVSGVPVNFTKVTVTFNNMNHTFPGHVDVLLVSPTGRKFVVMSDAGATNDWVNATITLDDNAAAFMMDAAPNPSGTYKPTNIPSTPTDPFPAPAPSAPYLNPGPTGTDTLTSAFVGQGDPNGAWSLYVVDDTSGNVGNFNGGWSLTFTLPLVCASPVTVNSVKTHAAAGQMSVSMPLVGNIGIEPRSGGGTNDYTLLLTMPSGGYAVSGSPQAEVFSGTGVIGTGGVSNGGAVGFGGGGSICTIPLTNVTNAQVINVRLNSFTDGVNSGNVVIPMAILIGDSTGEGAVNSADIGQTKAQSGQTVIGTNFRSDVNADGDINSADVSQVKARSGTSLP